MTTGAEANVTTAGDRRQAVLGSLGLLANEPETMFDRVMAMAAGFFRMDRAAIVLAGRDTLVVKAQFGGDLARPEFSGSFTEAAIATRTLLVVDDASTDPRFARNSIVDDPNGVRLYVGIPLHAPGGEAIGAFAMSSTRTRPFGETERTQVRRIAAWLEEELASQKETTRAAEVQHALQPKASVKLPGYEVVGTSTPARAVDGDFFDWYSVPGSLGLTLADVMGKGVGAALVAATVRAVIHTSAGNSGVAATVRRAARLLELDLEDTDSFVTLFHAQRRQADGRLRYVYAGHGLTLVVRADGRSEQLAHANLPLGTGLEPDWQRHTVWLEEGDTLISFSDGVLDLFDGSLASLEEVADIVRYTKTAAEAVSVLTMMAEYAEDSDDVVVIAVRRKGRR
ncbi:PP2C family protein-serine/threonine phosphatase [Cryobacterium sp. Y29]|uniref:PP2C family protein-serine/threonine phosphatase n=1 Tax=Cryobacterium sp. Y29 TaxID=2048285 RepID=UPI000CE33777|nr:SpoIIE family protein phosphatase [Cryobacterium sp. Y29]